jgi:hypothetical protein
MGACPRGGMVDTGDLKSLGLMAVPVRVRPGAPRNSRYILKIGMLFFGANSVFRIYDEGRLILGLRVRIVAGCAG